MRGSLRGGPGAVGRQVGFIVGMLSGLGLAVGALLLTTLSRGHGVLPGDLTVVLFNVLLAGWVVLPLLTFSGDDLLDPTRLALLPLTRRQLLTVMGVGGLVGTAPTATLLAALGLLPAVGTGLPSYAVALAAVVLLLALCVAASRAVAAALSGLLRSRRGRDLGVALAAIAALSVQLLNPVLQRVSGTSGVGEESLRGLAAPLRWTPAGLLAAAPTRAAVPALGSLLAVAALVLLLLVVWERSVRRMLEHADSARGRRRVRVSSLVPRGIPLPGGRVGAVAAKDLRVLVREPRRLIGTITNIALPLLILLGPLTLSGGRPPKALVFAVCLVAVMSGIPGANRFGLDGTATWVLVSSATDPRDARRDLAGGDLATAVVVVPVLVVATVGLAAVSDGWTYLAPALGCAFALCALSIACSGVVAVNAPYPVPESSNAFAGGNLGQGCLAGVTLMVGFLAQVVLALPLLALLLPALLIPVPWLGLLLLVAGPVYGLVVGHHVRGFASARWAQRATDVLHLLASGGR